MNVVALTLDRPAPDNRCSRPSEDGHRRDEGRRAGSRRRGRARRSGRSGRSRRRCGRRTGSRAAGSFGGSRPQAAGRGSGRRTQSAQRKMGPVSAEGWRAGNGRQAMTSISRLSGMSWRQWRQGAPSPSEMRRSACWPLASGPPARMRATASAGRAEKRSGMTGPFRLRWDHYERECGGPVPPHSRSKPAPSGRACCSRQERSSPPSRFFAPRRLGCGGRWREAPGGSAGGEEAHEASLFAHVVRSGKGGDEILERGEVVAGAECVDLGKDRAHALGLGREALPAQ